MLRMGPCGIVVTGFIVAGLLASAAHARAPGWVIRDGKFWVDGKWVFLKTAKPLRDFANEKDVEQLIADLEILQKKNYNCIEINCYWHHFDHNGDGTIDVPTAPLRKLVDAIYARGMFPCLSVETYGVGGGQIPQGFWKKHPDAVAVDSMGKRISDDEYGTGATVPTLFSPDYLAASRGFIENVIRSVDYHKLLYFETTVEPQFMGNHALDFSPHGKLAYEKWLAKNGLAGPKMPQAFPVSEQFLNDPVFKRFKAESLADWVNGDAAVFRKVAGEDAYIAVDYLETCGKDMRNRNGDSVAFLTRLTAANIIQVNWHWHVRSRSPNQCAYDNVRAVMKQTGRNWVVAEHMTINGSDYRTDDMEKLLRNTLRQGTRFSWEFTQVAAEQGPFSVYGPGWEPRPQMKVVDDQWEMWKTEIAQAAK